MALYSKLEKNKKESASRPQIFDLQNKDQEREFEDLLAGDCVRHVIDDYKEELKEYFSVCNPTLVFLPAFETKFEEYYGKILKDTPPWKHGRWAYFPWISTVAHILEENAFFQVRTARNRNLITAAEQEKFYNATIGVAGLSVGNSIVLAIVLQGGGKCLRLADHDLLALSNTNRIRAGVDSLGLRKTDMTARQAYLLNPYAAIELFPDGLTKENIISFFEGPPKLDIVVDEVDNLAVKYLIRAEAKRLRLPVVMGADNGDGAVIDIERYDLNPDTPFFQGRLGDVSYEKLANLSKIEIGQTIGRHIGMENVPKRMVESLDEVGKTLVSWPQLGGAAMLNGSAIALCVRRILNSQPLEDNRALFSLDKLIPPNI